MHISSEHNACSPRAVCYPEVQPCHNCHFSSYWNYMWKFVTDRSWYSKFLEENSVAVHTWNVAGKPPPDDLDLEEWIGNSQPADVYVFG